MKKRFLAIVMSVIMLSVALPGQEISNVTITLSDIKEALYGLLSDSQKNREDINQLIKNVNTSNSSLKDGDRSNKGLILLNERSVTYNSNSIGDNNTSILEINKILKQHGFRINKSKAGIKKIKARLAQLEKDNILYKSEIESFVEDNKQLLPEN